MIDCMAIVPCRKGSHVGMVVDRLHAQGAFVTVVRDRCDVECQGADAILDNNEGDGFLAGKCRDIGVDYALLLGAAGVIFIDEDCIPQDDLVKSHMEYLRYDLPVISLGRRLEEKFRWKDPREFGDAGNLHLFSTRGSVVQNPTVLASCLATWTCNMGMNSRAIQVIRGAMNRLCNNDRVFHPAFDGKWGGEDAFLGYVAWAYRVTMAYLPYGANAVKHMDHPRPPAEYNKGFKERLEVEVANFRMFLAKEPPTLKEVAG